MLCDFANKNFAYSYFAAHRLWVDVFACVPEDRTARNHLHFRQLGQTINKTLGDPIAEILAVNVRHVLLIAPVCKRQYSKRVSGGCNEVVRKHDGHCEKRRARSDK